MITFLIPKSIKKFMYVLTIMLIHTAVTGQHISKLAKWKVYGSYGLPMYWGHAREFTTPRSQDEYGTEYTSGYRLGLYKSFNNFWEIGANYGSQKINGIKEAGKSWGDKSIFESDVTEFGLTSNYSFNENLNLLNERFSYNGIIGIGAIQFSSAFYRFIPNSTNTIDKYMMNSVGLNRVPTPNHIYDKAMAYYIQLGFGVFYKLSPQFILSFENTIQVTSTRNLASDGNSNPSIKTYDSYSFSSLGLAMRFSPMGSKRMKCKLF
jgi:hypothetical protein